MPCTINAPSPESVIPFKAPGSGTVCEAPLKHVRAVRTTLDPSQQLHLVTAAFDQQSVIGAGVDSVDFTPTAIVVGLDDTQYGFGPTVAGFVVTGSDAHTFGVVATESTVAITPYLNGEAVDPRTLGPVNLVGYVVSSRE